MVFVEIAGTERHLGLSEDSLLSRGAANLMILNEEIPMLVLPMPIVYLLLEALDRWLLLVIPFADGNQVARIGHAMIARLPRASALCWDLVKVVLRHTSHLH